MLRGGLVISLSVWHLATAITHNLKNTDVWLTRFNYSNTPIIWAY